MAIDCDQHLYETRTMWLDHIDPADREDALAIVDDELGYPWLSWRGQRLDMADVQVPGDAAVIGAHRNRWRKGLPPAYSYDEALPDDYWDPGRRVTRIEAMGVEQAVLFPNFGLLWEATLSSSPTALKANMAAWNRWCGAVASEGGGRLHPVAHLTLRDEEWLRHQLTALSAGGVRLAMVAPAPVEGRPLSDADHDRLWAMFVDTGVSPVFHVANQPRALDAGWYAEPPDNFVSPLDSILLSTPPAIAITDMIINGTLARHPDLRVGIIELGAIWVPTFLLILDGGWEFTNRLNGRPQVALEGRPSDYFRRQVRVAAFSYEQPGRLARDAGDLFMLCSDFPHAEGTAQPLPEYTAQDLDEQTAAPLFGGNIELLLG